MLKHTGKILAFLLCSSFINSTFATPSAHSSVTVGKKLTVTGPNNLQVNVLNYTSDLYISHGTFQPTGSYWESNLYPNGSLLYNIVYPDSRVCLDIDRYFDGYHVYAGCLSSGTVIIQNYQNKPIVTFSK